MARTFICSAAYRYFLVTVIAWDTGRGGPLFEDHSLAEFDGSVHDGQHLKRLSRIYRS